MPTRSRNISDPRSTSGLHHIPFFGLRVLVTRSENDATEIVGKLRELGAIVYELPSIAIKDLELTKEKKSLLHRTNTFSWIIFTSVHAVTVFSKFAGPVVHTKGTSQNKLYDFATRPKAAEQNTNTCYFATWPKVAIVGPKTKQTAEQNGLSVAYMPDAFTGSELARTLPAVPGETVLWPCAEKHSADVEDELEKRGIKLTTMPLYATEIITRPDKKITDLIDSGQIDYSTCMSGSSVRGLVARVSDPNARKKLLALPLVSIGPKTTAVAKEYGFTTIVEAKQHTIEGMIEQLQKERAS